MVRYSYDEQSRLSAVAQPPGEGTRQRYAASMNLGPGDPAERIGFVQYIYAHPDLKTFEVKAWPTRAASQGAGAPIAHNKMEFNDRGQLIADWQSMGAAIGSSTEKTSYTWDVEYTDVADGWPVGRSRLEKMTYPNPPGFGDSSARRVTMGYGSDPLLPDAMLSRLAETKTSIGTGASSNVAAFAYIGSGRRARMTLANNAIAQDLGLDTQGPEIGLTGLDRFGRVADLHWRQGPVPASGQPWTGQSLTRLEYTYDSEGNRLTAVRTPRPTPGTSSGTELQVNAYDLLNRLTDCDINHHDGGATLVRDDHWDLDLLGNWNERVMNSAIVANAIDEHAVNNRNMIASLTRTVGAGSPATTSFRYDAAGNLQFDGEYAYQYDAWGRLLQINEASLGTGSPPPLILGNLVKHFAYDGLGRLIRVQSPYPAPGVPGGVRSERLYYDGIRRIQEVWVDPVDDTDDAAMAGDPAALEALAFNPELDGDVATLGTENSQTESSGGGGSPPPGVTLEREYIWGPGDNSVDELLVQYDRTRAPWWVLQDAGLDAIALCDLGSGGAARQATYDAYGSVLTAENPGAVAYAYMRAGHKGLFFDRLDVGVVNPSSGLEEKRLEPGAKLIGQVRNRAYAPDLGRFMQRDPNGTAAVLIESLAFGGQSLTNTTGLCDLAIHHADGSHTFQYLSTNPWTKYDSLGLTSFDMFFRIRIEIMITRIIALPQAPPLLGPSRTGSLIDIAQTIGQIAGAVIAAHVLDGRANLRNEALVSIIIDKLGALLGSQLGSVIGKGLGGRYGVPGQYGGSWIGGAVGNVAAGWSLGDTWSASAATLATSVGQAGFDFVRTGGTAGLLAGFALGAGAYGGMLEYAADTTWNWWKN